MAPHTGKSHVFMTASHLLCHEVNEDGRRKGTSTQHCNHEDWDGLDRLGHTSLGFHLDGSEQLSIDGWE